MTDEQEEIEVKKFLAKLQIGDTWRRRIKPNHPNNQIRHIRGLIDNDIIVYRIWTRRGWWRYEAKVAWSFWYETHDNRWRKIKGKR